MAILKKNSKLKHWRGFPVINGQKSAPNGDPARLMLWRQLKRIHRPQRQCLRPFIHYGSVFIERDRIDEFVTSRLVSPMTIPA